MAFRSRSRVLGVVVAACVLVGASGCSIVEEIDKIGKDTTPRKAAAAPADDLPAVPDGSNQAKLRAYYNRPGKKVEEDPDNPIVSCRLSGGTQFMRKHDCTLRGGRVTS